MHRLTGVIIAVPFALLGLGVAAPPADAAPAARYEVPVVHAQPVDVQTSSIPEAWHRARIRSAPSNHVPIGACGHWTDYGKDRCDSRGNRVITLTPGEITPRYSSETDWDATRIPTNYDYRVGNSKTWKAWPLDTSKHVGNWVKISGCIGQNQCTKTINVRRHKNGTRHIPAAFTPDQVPNDRPVILAAGGSGRYTAAAKPAKQTIWASKWLNYNLSVTEQQDRASFTYQVSPGSARTVNNYTLNRVSLGGGSWRQAWDDGPFGDCHPVPAGNANIINPPDNPREIFYQRWDSRNCTGAIR